MWDIKHGWTEVNGVVEHNIHVITFFTLLMIVAHGVTTKGKRGQEELGTTNPGIGGLLPHKLSYSLNMSD